MEGKKAGEKGKVGFVAILGTTLMSFTYGMSYALSSGWFMQHLTDYSGIGAYAAALGSILLVSARFTVIRRLK